MLVVGCTGPDSEKNSVSTENSSIRSESSEVKNEETVSSTKIYEIGDTCSDNLTRITINGKRYTDSINEINDESYTVKAENGYHYLILDITLENIDDNRSRNYAEYAHYKILSPDGYTYEFDSDASNVLAKPLDSSDVFPGNKRRGEVPFQVPINATDLKLQFMWDPINNHDGVIFNL